MNRTARKKKKKKRELEITDEEEEEVSRQKTFRVSLRFVFQIETPFCLGLLVILYIFSIGDEFSTEKNVFFPGFETVGGESDGRCLLLLLLIQGQTRESRDR